MRRQVTFSSLSLPEQLTWLQERRAGLQRKMQRERAYLKRRARRSVWTPTDEAYEADQQLEADLLALLDEMEEHLREGR